MKIILILLMSTISFVWADENHGSHGQAQMAMDPAMKMSGPEETKELVTQKRAPQAPTPISVIPDPLPEKPVQTTRQPSVIVGGVGQKRQNCDEPCINCAIDSSCRNTRAADSSRESKEIPASGISSHTGPKGSATKEE